MEKNRNTRGEEESVFHVIKTSKIIPVVNDIDTEEIGGDSLEEKKITILVIKLIL